MTDPQHGSQPAEDATTPPQHSWENPTSPAQSGAPYPPMGGYPPPSGGYEPPPSGYAPPAYPPPGYAPQGGAFPPPSGSGAYPPPYAGAGQPPYPTPGPYYDPTAPYGRDPFTGEPLSDKSKVIAGLLQLIGLFGLVGFGRIYLGQTGYGIAQLAVGLVTCGLGAVIWGIIDAIMIFTGSVRDEDGRPLRDGT